MLTKVSILHRDYLSEFFRLVPSNFLQHIDKNRNCEDIAMAYVVASISKAAPVWTGGVVYEVSAGGISSHKQHFRDRSDCLFALQKITQQQVGSNNPNWEWVIGYQKTSHISIWWDWMKIFYY